MALDRTATPATARPRRPRRARAMASAALAGLALAACGGVGGGAPAPGAANPGGPTSGPVSGPLTTMGFGLPDEVAKSRIDAFRQQFPQVQLKVNEGAFDEQQFLSAVAGGNPPNLVYLDREKVGTYAARGALQPLDGCLRQVGLDMGQFRRPAVEQSTYQGAVYAVPEFTSVRLLLVNAAAASEAGLSPTAVSTADWERLAAQAQQLTKRSGGKLTRIGVDPKVPEFFPLWVRANGGSLLSPDGRTAALDSPQAVQALAFVQRLVAAAGGYADLKAFRDTFDFFGAKNEFAQDQLGAMPMEDWYLNVLAGASPNAPVVVRPFLDRTGKPLTYATGQAWAVPKGAGNLTAACQFMKTMTATDTWVAAATAKAAARAAAGKPYTGTYTANVEADRRIASEVYRPSGIAWLDDGVRVLQQAQGEAFSLPASPANAEVKKAWTAAVNAVLEGRATPQEALARAQQEAQQALDKAAKAG